VTLEDVKNYLRDVSQNFNSRDSEPAKQCLAVLKQEAVAAGDQQAAKTIWCFEEIIEIQDKYIATFFQLKTEEFYDAWCTLERVEIELLSLTRHFQDVTNEFQISFIARQTSRYQSVFPYKLFMSPEIIKIEKTCSICKKVISIRNPCGHRVGEIYNGEMCSRIVTESELIGMSIVKDPMQKYSVPFILNSKGDGKKDYYNYSIIKYLIHRLESPFHEWDVTWTKNRHPHSRFSYVGRNDLCPCESGKKYKKCCLLEEGVLRPHCQFTFKVKPPDHLLTVEYID